MENYLPFPEIKKKIISIFVCWFLLHIVYKILCIADHEILISSSQELCRYEGNICLFMHLMQLKKVGEGHNYNMHVYIMKKVMVMLPYFRKKCVF